MAKGTSGQASANISTHLQGLNFPASKAEVIRRARQNGARQDVLDELNRMPDQEYGSMADVMKGYGQTH